MNWKLKPRERRIAIAGALIAAVVLGYVYGVEPLLKSREETRAQLQAARLRVDRYEQLLLRKARLAAEGKELEERGAALRERLLPGPTPTLAAAQLQDMVKAEARRSALTLQRMAVERPALTGQITEVPVHLTLKGEIQQASSFIRGVDQHRLALTIPEITIQVQDPKSPKDLIVDLVVAGYLVMPEGTRRPATTSNTKEGRAQ